MAPCVFQLVGSYVCGARSDPGIARQSAQRHDQGAYRRRLAPCVGLLISNEFLSPRRQLAFGFFGSNVMEVQKSLYSILGFDLYRLVPKYSRLFNPDAFRRIDESRYVGVGSASDDDLDP